MVYFAEFDKLPSLNLLTSPFYNNADLMKIVPCIEGAISDCQPEENSIRLRAMVVVEG